MTRIAIIAGSTRPNRKALGVAEWVLSHASARSDAEFEIVDLDDHPLPLLDEPKPAAFGPEYQHAHSRDWSQRIAGFDGFIFVTPEYNHSISGALKNALDYLYAEWRDKAAGFVGYGVDGGVRAVEHLRAILSELGIAHVHSQVSLSLFADFDKDQRVIAGPRQIGKLEEMCDQLVSWAGALAPLRDQPGQGRDGARPGMHSETHAAGALGAVTKLVAELQAGIDAHDAEIYNRHFADDVLWGSPFGLTLQGYDELHAIHTKLHRDQAGGSSSRYEIVQVMAPAPDVAIAHVRRTALAPGGQEMDPQMQAIDGAFSEMALYVLVRRQGTWWLAAGQNTPVR